MNFSLLYIVLYTLLNFLIRSDFKIENLQMNHFLIDFLCDYSDSFYYIYIFISPVRVDKREKNHLQV